MHEMISLFNIIQNQSQSHYHRCQYRSQRNMCQRHHLRSEHQSHYIPIHHLQTNVGSSEDEIQNTDDSW